MVEGGDLPNVKALSESDDAGVPHSLEAQGRVGRSSEFSYIR